MMVTAASILSQFIAVLFATLIGVFLAFRLDSFQEEQQTRQRTIDHLRSIRSEIESATERVDANNRIIKHLQRREMKGDHYILKPLETDAWLAALEEPIVGTISNELYQDLQETYSKIKAINSLIERQRDEMHHQAIGSEAESGSLSYEVWTMSVDYYDAENEEVDYFGLGPLVKEESHTLQSNDKLIEEIEEEIDRLDGYSLKQHLLGS